MNQNTQQTQIKENNNNISKTKEVPNRPERKTNILNKAKRVSYIHTSQMICKRRRSSFLKGFTVVNNYKANYCSAIYKEFFNFDLELFTNFVPAVGNSITEIQETKRGFYCVLCDADQHPNILENNGLIKYHQGYCHEILKKHIDYFRFMHIVYVRLADKILQYIQCFESNARVFQFPFFNYMNKFLNRIPFWERCFASFKAVAPLRPVKRKKKKFGMFERVLTSTDEDDILDSETGNDERILQEEERDPVYDIDEIRSRACWSICNKITMTRPSSLFEGNVKFFEKLASHMFSFVRKMNIEKSKVIKTNPKTQDFDFTTENLFMNRPRFNSTANRLFEPLNPSDFITNKRFEADRRSQIQILGRNNVTGYSQHNKMQFAVDELLKVVNLGDVNKLQGFRKYMLSFYPRQIDLNPKMLENEDRYISSVNKMVNNLYNLKHKASMQENLLPPRYLKKKVRQIIKKHGINPQVYERALHTYRWEGKNATYNGTFKPNQTLDFGFWDKIQTYGKKHEIIKGSSLGLSDSGLPENASKELTFEEREKLNAKRKSDQIKLETTPEQIWTVFEPTKKSQSLTNFGYTESVRGLNPSTYIVPDANWNVDYKKILRTKSSRQEKIDLNVMKMFLTCTAEQINNFNEQIGGKTMNVKELESRFPQTKKLENVRLVKFFSAISKDLKLNTATLNTTTILPEFSNEMDLMLGVIERNISTKMESTYLNQTRVEKFKKQKLPLNAHATFVKPVLRGHTFMEGFIQPLRDLLLSLFGDEDHS